MAIFKRLTDMLRANINDLLDKAEDPEKMVKQIILDMQKELQNATQALGKAMASERMAQKQYEGAVKVSQQWEVKAKAALSTGNVDVAKKALANKVKADKDAAEFKEMFDTISSQTDTIRNQVELLRSKLEEAKARQTMLIARSQMAKTQKDLAQSVGGIDASSAYSKLNRMEEKVMRQEAEAQAFADISGTAEDPDDDVFAQLETDSAVNDELERLMTQMGMVSEAPVTSAEVDAELSALQSGEAAPAQG